MMKYECLVCHRVWGNLTAGDDNISHGFCKRHVRDRLKEFIWKRQQRDGYQDCYAKGYEDCTEYKCEFWDTCTEGVVGEWERQEGICDKTKNSPEGQTEAII
jgi:hypothetical protein